MRFEQTDVSAVPYFVGPGTRLGDDETFEYALVIVTPNQTAFVIEGDPFEITEFLDRCKATVGLGLKDVDL